ncbi:hypothetical protein KXD40_002715 [Peronospora effusa]|uniref:PX domain-containing protein n=1 Tax=Peronospora effusa TaxID=542832 RepID=A0A3M6VC13_9STRA|nr:hypothetical protein DD238_008151 [Peronospora effusa]RQM13117.1 hypothetical protein DD237_008217 [Peronospora effusa]UIZ29858.1 hypothetical protein KXD40_002715 [Peronospora effusa]CAI5701459.1 unnamed protein product [Peronospora effusa]
MGCAQSKTEEVATTNSLEAETEATPAQSEAIPAQSEAAPAETEATPAETEATPAETDATPAETEPVTVEQVDIIETAVNETTPNVEEEEEEETAEPEAEAATLKEPAKEFYKITGHEIDEAGVVFYIVETVEGDVSFKKRFSEFKALVVELGSLKSLPALPDSGLGTKLRGKHNPVVIKKRETQLVIVLNAIANDVELAETDAFTSFAQ